MDFVSPSLVLIKDYLAEPITRHASYALQVKRKVENLRHEISELSVIEEVVRRKVDATLARLQTPFDHVINWQKKVKMIKPEVGATTHVIINQCSPNFLSKYKLGKQAAQYLLVVEKLKEEGRGFVASTVVDPDLPSPAEANFAALKDEVNTLTRLEEDIVSVVNNAKRIRGLQPKHQVEGWLLAVADHKLDAKSICDEFQLLNEQGDNLERNNWVTTISVNMKRTMEKTKNLINEGRSFTNESNVVDTSRPLVTVHQSEIPSIGQEKACADVLKLIEDDNVRLIGIYGMGGVGKTTILKRVNNSLEGVGYEIIIFVVVSGTLSIEGIQRDILKRLGSNIEGTSFMERESSIRNCLDGKKFILMLDDVWTELDLEEIGLSIHAKEKNYKILFTTRDESVCDKMKAKKVKIECLNNEEAWTLFETTVGEAIINSNPRIKKISELVAKECGGLPLALTVIGGAMRGKRTISEWSNALSTLRKFEPELTGTLDKLYMRLKFSYESLPNSIVKECFCYCALFPEDCVISTYSLVDCWIGEGFFDEYESIENGRNKGYAIIADLIRVCLLEGIGNDSNSEYESVKMHDVLRDMAQWIKKDKLVVFTPGTKAPKIDKWDKVERISLRPNKELGNLLEQGAKFPNLSTLTMEYGCLTMLTDDFFLSMLGLKVLHIFDKYESINFYWPSSTWLLNKLCYMNFGSNQICYGKELGALANLQILKVRIGPDFSTQRIFSDERGYEFSCEGVVSYEGVVPRLGHLRVLHISTDWISGLEDVGVKIAYLEALTYLEELKVPITTYSYMRELAVSPKLSHCVSDLSLIKLDMRSCRLSREIQSMDKVKRIVFDQCRILEEIIITEEDGVELSQNLFQNLKYIGIMSCPKLQTFYLDRTLLHLEQIGVYFCWPLQMLLSSRDGRTTPYAFPELQEISLVSLHQFLYICSDTFSFPV